VGRVGDTAEGVLAVPLPESLPFSWTTTDVSTRSRRRASPCTYVADRCVVFATCLRWVAVFELGEGGYPPVHSLEEWGGVSPSAVAERGVRWHVGVHRCRLLGVDIGPHDYLLWVGPRMVIRDWRRRWRDVVECQAVRRIPHIPRRNVQLAQPLDVYTPLAARPRPLRRWAIWVNDSRISSRARTRSVPSTARD